MDRVKVFSPALSGAAHAVAAGILTFAPLFVADRLPAPLSLHPLLHLGGGPVVLLGGGGTPGGSVQRVRLTRAPTPTRSVFSLEAPLVGLPVSDATLDLGTGGPAGIGEWADDGAGFCLFDCDAGPGHHAGAGPDRSEPAPSPQRVRVGGDVVSGHVLLNDAAVAAVSRWRYRPTLLNGEPVSVILTVTVSFSLR